jgi:hypothetical protein
MGLLLSRWWVGWEETADLSLRFLGKLSRTVERLFGLAQEKAKPVSQFLRVGMRAVR